MYTPSPTKTAQAPLRGETKGWTRKVSRRNTDFLLSVQADSLTGHGFAVSLTLKDCPPTSQDWQTLRDTFFKRLRRMGMIRAHWLTEWQRRGVPHMHAAIWFDSERDRSLIIPRLIQHWLDAASIYRAGTWSQDVKPITGPVGWFEYLAKHATRSVTNYQRSPETLPPGWKATTGRMWGHLGDWPVSREKRIEVDERPHAQYRRLMIRYQIGKARRQSDCSRVRYLKAYRSKAPRETSKNQALPRYFCPEDTQWTLYAAALSSHSEYRTDPDGNPYGSQPSIYRMNNPDQE